jgi:hypothetical protein
MTGQKGERTWHPNPGQIIKIISLIFFRALKLLVRTSKVKKEFRLDWLGIFLRFSMIWVFWILISE